MSDQTKYAKLREFYLGQYRPLYDRFVTEGASAQELHAEIAAAFDHLIRKGGDTPEDIASTQIDKIIGHIKRATFDAFKILIKQHGATQKGNDEDFEWVGDDDVIVY